MGAGRVGFALLHELRMLRECNGGIAAESRFGRRLVRPNAPKTA